jgi:hypothetical protein
LIGLPSITAFAKTIAPVSSPPDFTLMMQRLNRVFTRILILAVLAVGALAALGVFVLNESRSNLYEQKKADVRHVVEAGTSLLAALEKRVTAGEMTREQARPRPAGSCRRSAMRAASTSSRSTSTT